MRDTGDVQAVHAAWTVLPIDAWSQPGVPDKTFRNLEAQIRSEQGGSGTRYYRQVLYGRLNLDVEHTRAEVIDHSWFIGVVQEQATHVHVLLELSP